MSKKIRVGIIFGGRSGEHEVSLRSAKSVIEAIDKEKYEIVPIAISKEGRWLSPFESLKLISLSNNPRLSNGLSKHKHEMAILADPSRNSMLALKHDGNSFSYEEIDVIFPVLHGTYGEDGTIQGLFEMAGLPYVGCGVLASSCAMDKVVMKSLFRDAGLPICKYIWFTRTEWEESPKKILRKVEREISYPCFVKPANLGSSVGISRAAEKSSLEKAIDLAARYDRRIVIEEGQNAREIECAVLGNEEPKASLPGEYVVLEKGSEFLDYKEKYSNTGHVEFVVPAPLTKRQTVEVRKLALRAYKALDCAGFARVDFFLIKETGEILLNEINSIPGLTDVSGFPKMWTASGLEFPQVIEDLISFAYERHKDKSRNNTSL